MRQRLHMWAMSARSARWLPAAAVAGALIALAAWSFWQRWQLLSASPFPLGVDGYFYPIQLRSLLDRGELAYPSSPLAFYLLAPFALASDPITGAKLGAAFYGAAVGFPAYGAGARLGGSRGAGLIAAVLATTSVGSTYLTIEFVKNGIGLTVALAALWLVLRAAERPSRSAIPLPASPAEPAGSPPVITSRRSAIAAALAGLVAAWATHKMAAAVVGLVAIPVALAASTQRGGLRGRRLLYAVGGVVALAAAALALGASAPHRFVSAGDAQLLRGLWSATTHWSAPALVLPTGELALGHDALLGLALGLAAAILRVVRRRRARQPRSGSPTALPAAPPSVAAAAWPILALAIAIGLPLLEVADRQGLGFRLRLAAFVPMALSAALVARELWPRSPRREGWLIAAAIALAIARQPGSQLAGTVVAHPAMVSAAQALAGRIPPGTTLIVPERHIAFMIAWYTGAAVALSPDGVAPDRRIRVLPLHTIGADSPLDRALLAARAQPQLPPPLGVHPLHPNGLVMVAEPTWAWVLSQLPPADRAHFAAWPTI